MLLTQSLDEISRRFLLFNLLSSKSYARTSSVGARHAVPLQLPHHQSASAFIKFTGKVQWIGEKSRLGQCPLGRTGARNGGFGRFTMSSERKGHCLSKIVIQVMGFPLAFFAFQ